MGCNCKVKEYVRNTKRYYGYEPETKENISLKTKIKMVFKAIFMWIIVIVFFPFLILFFVLVRPFVKNKIMTVFKTLKIRI